MKGNETVCALSKAVIVIEPGPEVGKRSGSFATAKSAMKMGIPVYVYPSPLNIQPAKFLAKRGAHIIRDHDISDAESIERFVEKVLKNSRKIRIGYYLRGESMRNSHDRFTKASEKSERAKVEKIIEGVIKIAKKLLKEGVKKLKNELKSLFSED